MNASLDAPRTIKSQHLSSSVLHHVKRRSTQPKSAKTVTRSQASETTSGYYFKINVNPRRLWYYAIVHLNFDILTLTYSYLRKLTWEKPSVGAQTQMSNEPPCILKSKVYYQARTHTLNTPCLDYNFFIIIIIIHLLCSYRLHIHKVMV